MSFLSYLIQYAPSLIYDLFGQIFYVKTRLIWCAIAGGTRILQVDIPLSDNLDDVRKAISKAMKMRSCRLGKVWKVVLRV